MPRKKTAKKKRPPTKHFKLIFDNAPIAIMARDCSALARLKKTFQKKKITKIRTHLRTHPRLIDKTLKQLRIIHLNQEALNLFAASSKKELVTNLHKTYYKQTSSIFVDAFANLMMGKKELEYELRSRTLEGKPFDMLMKVKVPHAYEKSLKRVIIALEDISLQKKYERHLKRLAQTDGLTRVLNNSAIRERFEEEFLRARRYKLDLSVLMIDMDRFKRINDKRGHQKGDLVLRQTANLIKENLREVDVVGRYGGDEFMVILPETSAKDAKNAAERIRKIFEDLARNKRSRNIFSTLSIGIAGFDPKKVKTTKDMVTLADESMYAAKKAGRNSIVTL